MVRWLGFAGLLLLWLVGGAHAQIPGGPAPKTVTACGNTSPLPAPPVAGTAGYFTVDPNGNACWLSSGGAGPNGIYVDILASSGMAGFVSPSGCGAAPNPLTLAWILECDVTVNGASTVKAASTPSVYTDPALVVTLRPGGAFTIPGCSVGVASGQCLATATATNHVQIQNTSASATIACAWGVAAALNSITSVQLIAGQSAMWGATTSGIPTGALNCIASGAATPLYLEYN